MATITARQRKSYSHAYTGIAFAVLLAGAVGAAAGWAIGHQTRSESRSATAAQSLAQPAPVVDVSSLTPPSPADVSTGATDSTTNGIAVPPPKGGMAEQMEAQAAAAVTAPAQSEAIYFYLVGGQEEADARTALLSDQFAENGGKVSFAVLPTDTPEAQAAAYAEIEMVSNMLNTELHVVDLRTPVTDTPPSDAGFTSPIVNY